MADRAKNQHCDLVQSDSLAISTEGVFCALNIFRLNNFFRHLGSNHTFCLKLG